MRKHIPFCILLLFPLVFAAVAISATLAAELVRLAIR